jgi:ubiquinone/menaquinone biosynthesis C-methylase UbiE
LEVGPGPGFFSIDVARAIPDGRLELVDIQLEMLQKARERLRRADVRNTGYTRTDAVTLPFRPGAFDVAFLVAVLGEVPDPKAGLASIAHVLRLRGLLLVVELPGDPDAVTEEQVRRLTQGTGLEFVDSLRVSRGFLARFRRKAKIQGTQLEPTARLPKDRNAPRLSCRRRADL